MVSMFTIISSVISISILLNIYSGKINMNDDINDNVKLKFSGASTFHGSIDNVYLIKVPNNLAITDEQIGVLTGDLQSIQSQLISTFVDITNISKNNFCIS